MTQQNDHPIKEFRASGAITAAVWRNEENQKDGNIRVRYSVKIQKRFCDKNNNWKDSDYFFPEDLPKVELLARKAFEYITLSVNKEADETVPI